MTRRSPCPRCHAWLLDSRDGRACPCCGGVFLNGSRVGKVVTYGMVMDEIIAQGVPGVNCPGCGVVMLELRLHAQVIDRCGGCGGVWLDVGETLEDPAPSTAAGIPSVARVAEPSFWATLKAAVMRRRVRAALRRG